MNQYANRRCLMKRMVIISVLTFLLSACGSANSAVIPNKKLGTSTPSGLITIQPSSTSQPTETSLPTATLSYPLAMNTALPKTEKIIKSENIDQLSPLASWGYGQIENVAISSDLKFMSVATYTGFHIYDTKTLALIGSVNTMAPIKAQAFSPDGKILATGNTEHIVQLWDSTDFHLINSLEIPRQIEEKDRAYADGITDLRFTDDGNILEIGGGAFGIKGNRYFWTDYVKYWNINLNQLLTTFEDTTLCKNKISPNGKEYAVAMPDSVNIISVADGSTRVEVKITQVKQVFYSPNGQILVIIAGDTISLINTEDGSQIKKIYGKALEFFPDGHSFVTSKVGGIVEAWSISNENYEIIPLTTFSGLGTDDFYFSLEGSTCLQYSYSQYEQRGALSPDGKFIALINTKGKKANPNNLLLVSEKLEVISVSDGTVTNQLTIPQVDGGDLLEDFFFYPGHLITTNNLGNSEKIVRVWDLEKNNLDLEINPSRPTLPIAFSPDNKFLVSYPPDGAMIPHSRYGYNIPIEGFEIALWDVDNGHVVENYSGFPGTFSVISAQFSAEGKSFSYNFRPVYIFGRESATQWIGSGSPPENTSLIAYSSNITKAVAKQKDIEILRGENTIFTLKKHEEIVTAMSFSADGSLLASGDGSGMVVIWDMKTGEPVQEFREKESILQIHISPANNVVIIAPSTHPATLNLWELSSGKLIKELDRGWDVNFTFSPEGSLIASASRFTYYANIRIFSTDGDLVRTIYTPYREMPYVSFSPGGTKLAMAFPGSVQIWSIGSKQKYLEPIE